MQNDLRSPYQRFIDLPDDPRAAFAAAFTDAQLPILTAPQLLAHPGQLPPGGDWTTWLILAGRGFGKTWAGAAWVDACARSVRRARIALVGATLNDARSVMVEGDAGVLAVALQRPRFEPARRLLTWATTLATASGRLVSRASVSATGWATTLAAASGRLVSRASVSATGWSTTLAAGSGRLVSQASVSATGWATTLAAAPAVMATRAATTAIGWTATLGPVSARIATRASAGFAAWAAALFPDAARHATLASDARTDWIGGVFPDGARLAMRAASGIASQTLPGAIVPAACRVVIVDRTLPTLLPGSIAPPERTLVITGDFRTATIPAD